MKSQDDGSRGPCGPDESVTPRYITKKSPRNVQHGVLETSLTISRVFSKFEFFDYTGFTLLVSYTLSKAIGDVCGNSAAGDTTNCGYQDPRNMRAERSLDNIDIPHRFVASGVYELPFGAGRRFGGKLRARSTRRSEAGRWEAPSRGQV